MVLLFLKHVNPNRELGGGVTALLMSSVGGMPNDRSLPSRPRWMDFIFTYMVAAAGNWSTALVTAISGIYSMLHGSLRMLN